VEQVTTINTTGRDTKNPSIIFNKAEPVIISEYVEGTAYFIISFVRSNSSKFITLSSWGNVNFAGNIAYSQANPSAVFVPQSINGLANGRIEVAWQGYNATNTTNYSLYYSYSDDGGVTWSTGTVLAQGSSSLSVTSPSVTASKDGKIVAVVNAQGTNSNVAKIVKSGGTWGSLTNITNLFSGTNSHYPSALYDPTFTFTEPLFIYKDTAKVGFYGTWSITTISVTPGDIGAKSDRYNFLNYSITTDSPTGMSIVTLKINGNTVASKNLANGVQDSIYLSQAQWDAIKYGKYKDATGGLNTLTVTMGSDTWTYTFDKRLATGDDVLSAVKAVQDSQNTFLPAVKAKLGGAIRGKGGTVNDTDSWDTMVNAVGGIPLGKKWASGTATSGGSVNFTSVGGTTISAISLTVSGLTFTPSIIYLYYFDSVATSISLYNSNINDRYNKSVKVTSGFGAASGSAMQYYHIKGDVAPASISSTGFTLPVYAAGVVYQWLAIE
jgi:hypothetical protein